MTPDTKSWLCNLKFGWRNFFRHLGNIRNAKGENSIKNTIMYDGTHQMNILDKTTLNMRALLSRNITIGGTLQVLKIGCD